jgi:pimeloyl-ACP methyl ester carboxylesterase
MIIAPQPVTDELIELRGLRFHYRDWPSKRLRAPTLVLLHGFTGHARSWDAFAEAMTDRYRVLALDQRGHGETAWAPPDRYGRGEMVDDLAAFVKALGLKDFALLGLSMGGGVTFQYAGRRPKELACISIVDIAPEVVTEGIERIRVGVRAKDVFASVDEAFAQARKVNPRPPEAIHRARINAALMRTEDGQWTWRYDRALRASGPPPRDVEAGWQACANINVPAQLIRGEFSDILSPAIAKRMMATIPDLRFDEVKDSGHPVPLDAPEGFLKAAREFLVG